MVNRSGKAWCWLSVLLLLLAACATATATPEDEEGWELRKDRDGLRIYNRERPGSPIRELLAVTTIDQPVWRLAAVIGDYENFKEFMPYTEVSARLAGKAQSETVAVNYFFTALEIPIISNRYYTLRLVDEWSPDGRPGAFRSRWTLSTDPGLNPDWDDPAVRRLFPEGFSEPIHTAENDGYWLLEPIDGGRHTRVTYYVYLNPGGSIPGFIANRANTVAVPKLMRAVRERSLDRRYDAQAPR